MSAETYRAAALAGGSQESQVSAVSWQAILAGAAVAAATGLILLALGAGVGLATVSPWGGSASAGKITAAAAAWLIVVQWLSSALGGYVTGRLRTKWVGLHDEEVMFRDTAHGLLAWAAAVIVAAIALSSASTYLLGGDPSGARPSAAVTAENYYVDMLFRGATGNGPADAREQAQRIFAQDAKLGGVTNDDRAYLGQLVAARTGLSKSDGDKRVSDVLDRAKSDLDQTRKTTAAGAIFIALSLLVGAFVASAAGAIGGRARDL